MLSNKNSTAEYIKQSDTIGILQQHLQKSQEENAKNKELLNKTYNDIAAAKSDNQTQADEITQLKQQIKELHSRLNAEKTADGQRYELLQQEKSKLEEQFNKQKLELEEARQNVGGKEKTIKALQDKTHKFGTLVEELQKENATLHKKLAGTEEEGENELLQREQGFKDKGNQEEDDELFQTAYDGRKSKQPKEMLKPAGSKVQIENKVENQGESQQAQNPFDPNLTLQNTEFSFVQDMTGNFPSQEEGDLQ